MPNDANFLAVKFVKAVYNPHFDTENLIVTTRNYHNFEFTIVYDDAGKFISCILHRVYYRYGFYMALNDLQVSNGFIAIGYKIPYDQ
jgi:hypothetical protein